MATVSGLCGLSNFRDICGLRSLDLCKEAFGASFGMLIPCAWKAALKNWYCCSHSHGKWRQLSFELTSRECLLVSEFDSQQQLLLRGNSKIKIKVILHEKL